MYSRHIFPLLPRSARIAPNYLYIFRNSWAYFAAIAYLLDEQRVSLAADATQSAVRLECPAEAAKMLYGLLYSVGILRRKGDTFHTTYLSRRMIRSLSRTGRLNQDSVKRNVQQLKRSLARGDRENIDTWKVVNPEYFFGADSLHTSRSRRGAQLVNAVPQLGSAKCIMDVGGACGGVLIGMLRGLPDTRGIVVDLPAVEETARERIQASDIRNRLEFMPCDFLTEPLPQKQADAIVLSHVLHDWRPDTVVKLLQKARKILSPEGMLVVVEYFLDEDGLGSTAACFQNFCVWFGSSGGRQYTEADLEDFLRQAQFQPTQRNSRFTKDGQGFLLAQIAKTLE